MSKFRRLLLFFPMVALTAVGCAPVPESADTSHDSLNVVCTTNVVKDLVAQVGGDRITVTAIMDGPGIDPHTYVTSPGDINTLTAADVVVYSGLHLEGQFDEPLESLRQRGIPVICLTAALAEETPSRLIAADGDAHDPHVWFDPDLWGDCAVHFAEQMGTHDPVGADDYLQNAQAYAAALSAAGQTGRDLLATINPQRRVLVTAHDAFAYFARYFDFSVEAVQGISTDSEPGLRRINELIELLCSRKISAVFTEQSVSDRNIRALLEGCRAQGHTLSIGGVLYSDTVGEAGTAEASLTGALLHNIREIADSLGDGVAP
ncbi:MAG: zinc ABC transporter substrate-binding protein [Planctomycetaceae bacterium]|nr:zinc ABC transporter substrate-binding protein [Planctomycetaceae bacterium]